MNKPSHLKLLLSQPVQETYGMDFIQKSIPHRKPFLLVDEIRIVEPRKKYIGVHHVRADEYYFKGHFPEMPVMPGVLIVESMSQAFGAAAMQFVAKEKGVPLFLSIEEAKFRGMVKPGDTLEMPLEILRLGKISKIYAEAYVNGKLCAQATLNFILGEIPHD